MGDIETPDGILEVMTKTGLGPDFITVDGGEGGTGAAPLEYSNSIGMPLNDGLSFVIDCLNGFNLKIHNPELICIETHDVNNTEALGFKNINNLLNNHNYTLLKRCGPSSIFKKK